MSTSEAHAVKPKVLVNCTEAPSELIDAKINALADWRGESSSQFRALIKAADRIAPDFEEDSKDAPWTRP